MPVMYAAAGNCHVYVDATRRPRRRAWRSRSTRRCSGRRSATRPRRCSCTPTSPPSSCRARSRELRERASSCAWTAARARWPATSADSLAEATEEDWATEYHALILAVKVVDSLEEAIEHVNRYGAGTPRRSSPARPSSAQAFTRGVDAGVRVRQRLHALHRRRRVRDGRRDRQLDPEAARARADRPARADHLQVRGRRLRAGPRVAGLRVGILGGAFNPPHIGHLICAQEALVQLELDVVCSCRWARRRTASSRTTRAPRRGSRWSSWRSRTTSASRARGSRSTARGRRTRPTRCAQLRAESPKDELFLILGGDQAAALPTWHEPEEVLGWRRVAVVERLSWSRTRSGSRSAGMRGVRAGALLRHAADRGVVHRDRAPRRGASRSGIWCLTRWPSTSRRTSSTARRGAPRRRRRSERSGPDSSSAALAERIAEIAADKKAMDIRVLDLRGIVSLHRLLRDLLRQHGAPDEGDPRRDPRGAEDDGTSACCPAASRATARRAGSCWTTSTGRAHLHAEAREYYRLEQLWGEAPARSVG